jgi:hypothetical protein
MTPRIENQMTKRAPKRSPIGPPKNACGRCAEEQEQHQLRFLNASAELLDGEEGEIARQAGEIGVLRRRQDDENDQRPDDLLRGSGKVRLTPACGRRTAAVARVPDADPGQNHEAGHAR